MWFSAATSLSFGPGQDIGSPLSFAYGLAEQREIGLVASALLFRCLGGAFGQHLKPERSQKGARQRIWTLGEVMLICSPPLTSNSASRASPGPTAASKVSRLW